MGRKIALGLWIHTMKRCPSSSLTSLAPTGPRLRCWLLALCLVSPAVWLAAPAAAQFVPAPSGAGRNFPEAALRGTLTLQSTVQADISGQSVRLAPGMRLLNPQNALVMLHTAIGQPLTVNYLIERSTGMLLTAWILSPQEAAQSRPGDMGVQSNYRTDPVPTPAR